MNKNIQLSGKKHSFHIVGIFGIGMSGLAQYLKWKGFDVSGSDRAVNFSENELLYDGLSKIGIKLYDQDGSYIKNRTPDYIVYSTAIEDDNPDFTVGKNILKLHRTEILVKLFEEHNDKKSIAVAGTCGKTTVSSLIAETFAKLNFDPFAIVGGFVNSFMAENLLGNFRAGDGEWMIFESDESDKSLLRFYPDYSILLNIGTDHYSKEELIIVFEKFLKNTAKGAVIEKGLCELLDPKSYEHLEVVLYSAEENNISDKNMWILDNYMIVESNISVDFKKNGTCEHFRMPVPGRYNAGNFLAVCALYELLRLDYKVNKDTFFDAMSSFGGVHRRFEYAGSTLKNVHVYCDFAHSVNKIESAVKCAKELTNGNVIAIFQPHGYKPLRFMREELFSVLENSLHDQDRFILLPVYYPGGTCVAEPKVEDVIKQYSLMSENSDKFISFDLRNNVEEYLAKIVKPDDIILVMGARDNTLPIWSKNLVQKL
jgi:UDP-N-acetylmuramate--alanine ligase